MSDKRPLPRDLRPEHLSALRRAGRFRLAGFLICTIGPAAACGEAPEDRRDPPQADGGTSAGVVDWNGRTISFTAPEWTLEFCEGEGPFLCVARGSDHVGSVELLRHPVDRHTTIAEVLGRGGSDLEALEAAAAEFVAGLAADRRIGLGEEYHLRADPPVAVTVMGKQGLRLVVEGGIAGRIHERVVQYHAIHGASVYLLAATGIAGGGPLGEFTIQDLKAFEPTFGEIAAVSRAAPAASAPQRSCEVLETDLLNATPSRAGLRRVHGAPDSVLATTEPNRHVQGAVDSLFTVFYPGFVANFRTPTGGRDLIASAIIADNRYVSEPRIGIGARAAAVVELLGEPTRREGADLIYDCGPAVEQPVRFEVRDGRVSSISIAYYVDS